MLCNGFASGPFSTRHTTFSKHLVNILPNVFLSISVHHAPWFLLPDIVNRKLLYKESVDSGFQEPIGECMAYIKLSLKCASVGKGMDQEIFPL